MTSIQFCFWLQGYFELALADEPLNAEQVTLVRKHLALVFKHEIDPSMGSEEHQNQLNQTHGSAGMGRC